MIYEEEDRQEWFDAYYKGYKQGRFDEYAERMGHEQAERVKAKLEKQKNCPYCHTAEKTAPYTAIDHDGHPFQAIGFYSDSGKDIASVKSKNAEFKLNGQEFTYKIKYRGVGMQRFRYCPMCGRPLNEEN